jgi:TDG/mug DNA glycosylase family protein
MDRTTIAVYDRQAEEWKKKRPARHPDRAEALAAAAQRGLPVLDAGCGNGPYFPHLGASVIGFDASAELLALARRDHAGVPLVRADLARPPFRGDAFGAAWARNSYLHVDEPELPLALAELHWVMAPGAPLALSMLAEHDDPGDDPFAGRRFSQPTAARLGDLLVGAGFDDVAVDNTDPMWGTGRRARTLPDTVGPSMRALVCGLNPSVVAADAGYGFAGRTNRFWAAALAAGLVTRARDPRHALTADAVGMTDLVKRATPAAKEIRRDEYAAGADRVRRLVAWLGPSVVVFVGLAGYRAAVDRSAVAGPQRERFGGRPAYVMPSTSGLNARTSLDALVDHLIRAQALN